MAWAPQSNNSFLDAIFPFARAARKTGARVSALWKQRAGGQGREPREEGERRSVGEAAAMRMPCHTAREPGHGERAR
jgi:hypothetical protein